MIETIRIRYNAKYNLPVYVGFTKMFITQQSKSIHQKPTSGRLNVSKAGSIAPWHVTSAASK